MCSTHEGSKTDKKDVAIKYITDENQKNMEQCDSSNLKEKRSNMERRSKNSKKQKWYSVNILRSKESYMYKVNDI